MVTDIQTGRNVYVDVELLNSDEEYRARIESMVAEGFFPQENSPERTLLKLIMSAGSGGDAA